MEPSGHSDLTGRKAAAASRGQQRPEPDLSLLDSVRESPFFRSIPPEELTAILNQASRGSYKAGACLFRQGDPAEHLFLLAAGCVRITRLTAGGEEVLLDLVSPGEFCGYETFAESSAYIVSAKAARDSRVGMWNSEAIRQLLLKHPQLSLNALATIVGVLHKTEERYGHLTSHPVEQRIARALADVGRRFGARTETSITVPLLEKDLADLAVTTVFSVSRVLSAWQKRGLIRKTRGQITLLDIDRLARGKNRP
jgi:CRP-like cAMP-binding protein